MIEQIRDLGRQVNIPEEELKNLGIVSFYWSNIQKIPARCYTVLEVFHTPAPALLYYDIATYFDQNKVKVSWSKSAILIHLIC
jgi:hypothetical protein